MRINIKAIKIRMVERGWTQQELADQSGLSRQCISYVFRKGSCRLQTAHKIAKALGMDVEEMWEDE